LELKEEKNKLPTLVILLVSKLQAGNEVKAQPLLKEAKKLFSILVILLVSKLQAGSDVKDQ
jgi:hypothetical protein